MEMAEDIDPIDVILGVDFGTRFTKICYRILDGSDPQVVEIDIHGEPTAIIDSVLWIDPETQFISSAKRPLKPTIEPLNYLKMLLRQEQFAGDQAILQHDWMKPTNITIRSLSAYLLYQMLRRCILAVEANDARFKSQPVNWTLNLSIPTQYADDGFIPVFREVGAVSLLWAIDHDLPLLAPDVTTIRRRYELDRPQAEETMDVSVFPEIVAALHEFIKRPQTPEGIHGFLDVGAGTLDACIFRIKRNTEEVLAVVLSAAVDSLGAAAVSARASHDNPFAKRDAVEAALVQSEPLEETTSGRLKDASGRIKFFFAGLVLGATRNMPGGLGLVHDPIEIYDEKSRDRELNRSFDVHTTGGGAKSWWYKTHIEEKYAEGNFRSLWVIPWKLKPLEPAQKFDRERHDYGRHVIAWGLTAESDDLEELMVVLPSELNPGEKLPDKPIRVPIYEGH
jgi:hypothetical protein